MSNDFPSGHLALPPGDGPAPAVLVIHAWWGLNAFFRSFVDRLGEAGFVVFAPDLYDGKVATTVEDAAAYRDESDANFSEAMATLQAALAALRQHPRATGGPVGVVGVSLGVWYALELLEAVPDAVGAVVVFYGTRPMSYADSSVPVLGHFAEIDAFEPKSDQKAFETALQSAGHPTTFYEYPGTGHWFFENDVAAAYNAEAAELAWSRTVDFLKQTLNNPRR